MVRRPRIRAFFTALGLYVLAGLLIGYFAINAYTGSRGLRARQDIEQRIAALTRQIDEAKAERAQWERRVALLRSDHVDADMLDERARALLDYADPHDLVLMPARR